MNVRLAAANRGVRCRRRRQRSDGRHVPIHDVINNESRPSTELGLTVLNVFKKKLVLKEFSILCGVFVC
jgi:hypothetical protein